LRADWHASQRKNFAGLGAISSVLFLCSSTPTHLGAAFVADLVADREVYVREFADSYYRPISYCVYRILTEIPAAAVSSLLFSSILYFAVELHSGAPYFFFFVLCTFVNMMVAILVGFSVSSILPGDLLPTIALPCFATLQTLVAGLLVSRSTLTVVWRWLYTISYEQWLWAAMMSNQFGNVQYDEICHGHKRAPPLCSLPECID